MSRGAKPKKERRRKRRLRPIGVLVIAMLVIVLVAIVYIIGLIILPTSTVKEFEVPQWSEQYAGTSTDAYTNAYILHEHTPVSSTYKAKIKDSSIYLSINYVRDYADEFIYFDNSENLLTITETDKIIRIEIDSLSYTQNKESLTLEEPVILESGTVYLPASFVEKQYNMTIKYLPEKNIIAVEKNDVIYSIAAVSKKAAVRHEPSPKSPIGVFVEEGTQVTVVEQSGTEWFKIITSNGQIGYTYYKNLGNSYETVPIEKTKPKQYSTYVPSDGKIEMVWEQLFSVEANTSKTRTVPKGLDVISPTWFSVKSADEITDIGDIAYVNWAHANNIQVWALVDNDFDAKATHDFLMTSASRKKIIDTLISYAKKYNLDGINIDFESVAAADGAMFVQFMREASVSFKEEGLIVTCDVYVPAPWTSHYYRKALAQMCDYLIVMAYDEHWATSPESGSVASIGWVRSGIENTLSETDQQNIILGIPFYTRIWTEASDGKVSSKAYGMQQAYDIFIENGAEFAWDPITAQYYAEYMDGSSTIKVWLEDKRSITEKVALVNEYDLAGMAAWKFGLELDEVWDVIYEQMKNQ